MQTPAYERLAALEVRIDGMRRHRLEFPTPRWTRVSTVVVFTGAGVGGYGEDISYDPADQDAHQRMPPVAFAGRRTLGEWCAMLDEANIIPEVPTAPEVREYRRWAYESALLDLALRQAGCSLAEVLAITPRPVRFCVSPAEPLALLQRYPRAELKIDASADWTDAQMARLAATGRVRVVDLKAHYAGDWVKRPDDPLQFSRRVAAAFPDAVLEDAAIGRYMEPFHEEERHRTSFDAPVHAVADLRALPPTRWCNIKPSRFGTIAKLFACIEHCRDNGIATYGGGQFEIGPGRSQIQALAGLFSPDGPNDVAPGGYNARVLPAGLPASPLPAPVGVGLGREPEDA